MQRVKKRHNSLLTKIFAFKSKLLGGGKRVFRHKNTKLNQSIKLAVIAVFNRGDCSFNGVFVFGHCKAPFHMTNQLIFYHIIKISQYPKQRLRAFGAISFLPMKDLLLYSGALFASAQSARKESVFSHGDVAHPAALFHMNKAGEAFKYLVAAKNKIYYRRSKLKHKTGVCAKRNCENPKERRVYKH